MQIRKPYACPGSTIDIVKCQHVLKYESTKGTIAKCQEKILSPKDFLTKGENGYAVFSSLIIDGKTVFYNRKKYFAVVNYTHL
jgi:hypothetical protein